MVSDSESIKQPSSTAVKDRKSRKREEELLVWPDLVFIEFISALLFMLTLTLLSILINAPLQDRANPAHTPNPSKAPWYFLNLQELLLHMHPAIAGVLVPTIAVGALMAIPYIDNTHEGEGGWWASERAKLNAKVGAVVGFFGTLLLILFNESKHVWLFEKITPFEWPSFLNWLRNTRTIQTDIPWPDAIKSIPVGEKILKTELLGLPPSNLVFDIPKIIVEQVIPMTTMIVLPIILGIVAHKTKIAQTKRDHAILIFSAFMATWLMLTISGTALRGAGMELMWPWEVKPPVT
jgi:quinol-cytochrome oxidoreductase complex cytochrome b subunit